MSVVWVATLLAILMAAAYYWLFFTDPTHCRRKASNDASDDNKDETVPPLDDGGGGGGNGLKQNQHPKKKNQPESSSTTAAKSKTSSSSGTTRPSDPRYLRRFGGHTGTIVALSLSPDGEWIATAGTDGQIRVTRTSDTGGSHLYLQTNIRTAGGGVFQDHASAISWSPDGRTVVCAIRRSREIAFYRVRRKTAGGATVGNSQGAFPYELIELVKRRFATNLEEGTVMGTCLWDLSHSNFCLILTNHGQEHNNTAVWDGSNGASVGRLTTAGNGVLLSPDGRFLIGRVGPGAAGNQVKIFEVRRSKVKGEAEPVFDKILSKNCMTVVPGIPKAKVTDLDFCDTGRRDGSSNALLCLGCDDGTVQIWDLDVEYRNREDPKLLCSANVLPSGGDGDGRNIVRVAACFVGDAKRIVVVTSDGSFHLLTYSTVQKRPCLSLDFSIRGTHPEGVGDVHFCPVSGSVLYSRGVHSRDVFAWNVDK